MTLESYAHIFLLSENAVRATWLYLVSGLLIGLIVILHKPSPATSPALSKAQPITKIPWFSIGVLLLSACAIPFLAEALREVPLDYRRADMLPIMQVMSERFLSGTDPYAPIPEIWTGMQPIYLPAMWLPYLPAIAFDFDMRWMGILFLVLGCLLLGLGKNHRLGLVPSMMVLIPLGLLLYGLTIVNSDLLTLTEEGLSLIHI